MKIVNNPSSKIYRKAVSAIGAAFFYPVFFARFLMGTSNQTD